MSPNASGDEGVIEGGFSDLHLGCGFSDGQAAGEMDAGRGRACGMRVCALTSHLNQDQRFDS